LGGNAFPMSPSASKRKTLAEQVRSAPKPVVTQKADDNGLLISSQALSMTKRPPIAIALSSSSAPAFSASVSHGLSTHRNTNNWT
jgi:hypothetical protein